MVLKCLSHTPSSLQASGTHQEDGTDRLGGVGHIDGSIVATHFSEVGQGSTVIQVEMAAGGEEGEEKGIMVGPLNPALSFVVPT